MNFFDITNQLTAEREYGYSAEVEAEYQPFLINRAMSNYYDCCMHANEMNQRSLLTKQQQYDYYFYAIQPKKKRFSKWHKPAKDERVKVVSEFYNCSISLAEQYSTLLTDEDIQSMREKISKGGRSK